MGLYDTASSSEQLRPHFQADFSVIVGSKILLNQVHHADVLSMYIMPMEYVSK